MKPQRKRLLSFLLMEFLFLAFGLYIILSIKQPNYYIISIFAVVVLLIFVIFVSKMVKWSKNNNPQLYQSKAFSLHKKLSTFFTIILFAGFVMGLIVPCFPSTGIGVWASYIAVVLVGLGFAYFIFFGMPYVIYTYIKNKNIKFPLEQFLSITTPRTREICRKIAIGANIFFEIALILIVIAAIKYLMHAMK